MNSFKLIQMAKKLPFCPPRHHLAVLFRKPTGLSVRSPLSFFLSIAQLCNLKKSSSGHKTPNFRLIPKNLNEFYKSKRKKEILLPCPSITLPVLFLIDIISKILGNLQKGFYLLITRNRGKHLHVFIQEDNGRIT